MEEKPFRRITKRLLTPNSLISAPSTFLPTPPPDSAAGNEVVAAEHEAEKQKLLEEWRSFHEDITLDFAAFESSVARIHFLLSSNEKERERYASEKLRILSTAKEVKDNTAELRVQLEEAQKTLALRKTYDELADKITSNRLLRPREDQEANLEKLNAEIAKLETESMEYAQTWSERREQFGRIVDEGMNLRRLIRDEKEEVERREGMEEGGDGDEGETSSKGKRSAAGTPRLDQGGATPSHAGIEEANPAVSKLQAEKPRAGGPRARTPLRQTTTVPPTPKDKQTPQEAEDENMVDEGEVTGDESAAREVTATGETRSASRAPLEEFEEGEEVPDDRPTDKMDTT